MTKFVVAMSLAAGCMFAQASKPGAEERLIDSIKGVDLYKSYCAVCHGTNAKGNGPMASTLKVAPPDLTHLATRNGGTFPKALVASMIQGTGKLVPGHGTKEMPIWGPIFSQVTRDQDLGHVRIDNLTRYLESIQAK
jgi:mono/diheme cytochrome c family protein